MNIHKSLKNLSFSIYSSKQNNNPNIITSHYYMNFVTNHAYFVTHFVWSYVLQSLKYSYQFEVMLFFFPNLLHKIITKQLKSLYY